MKGRRLMAMLLAAVLPAGLASGAPPACTDSAYRQFDFWLGEWQVFKPDGTVAGINVITRRYDGCVLHERYTTARGYAGESLNTYDAARQRWHQTWVDNGGTLLLLEGGLRGGRMILEGAAGAGSTAVRHRITWTPNADGTVRQLWESTDAAGAWTVAFDGRYRRVRR